jgi:hypothetical protein
MQVGMSLLGLNGGLEERKAAEFSDYSLQYRFIHTLGRWIVLFSLYFTKNTKYIKNMLQAF